MKSQNKMLRKRRAVSPVIATVILVAVTITVAVAVSYWMSGIASQYTAFEKVEIQTAICSWKEDTTAPPAWGYWEIEIKLKNSGTATATLTNLFINDIEVDSYTADSTATPPRITDTGIATTDMTETKTIESGDTVTVYVYIDGSHVKDNIQWQKVSSGTTINIKIHSAGGLDYIRLVRLT